MAGVENRARLVVARALSVPVENVPANASLDTYDKWDSLGHVRVVLGLEDVLGRPLETDEVVELVDLEGVAELLRRNEA